MERLVNFIFIVNNKRSKCFFFYKKINVSIQCIVWIKKIELKNVERRKERDRKKTDLTIHILSQFVLF